MPVCLDVPYARNDFSPAAGWATKMTENSPHQATIPYRLYIVPLHLLSIFFFMLAVLKLLVETYHHVYLHFFHKIIILSK